MADHLDNTSPLVKPLRHVVIGVGAGVFKIHRPALQLETAQLVAVSDINVELGQQRAAELGCVFYADYQKMLAETQPDVAVVITPHPFHASIAIDCLRAGCHVLVEKPMAVQVAEADAMVKAATQADRLLAVNFQSRHSPEVRTAYNLIQEGRLGTIQHIHMAQTWTRAGIYYQLATWRGTWAGEGAGVLLNQAPHNLDLLCHLLGMPHQVVAWTRTLLHQIETEDTVQAMLEWPSGALGSLHISTAEAGRPSGIEILGTGGRLQLGPGELFFERFEPDVGEHIRYSSEPFSAPSVHPTLVEIEAGVGNHVSVYRNLHEAILQGAPVMADGVEGRMSLELANAMIYASYTQSEVELPLDRQQYAALLNDLRTNHSSPLWECNTP